MEFSDSAKRVLTGAAFSLGFLAIVASLLLVSAYFILYRPKQVQLLRDFSATAQAATTNPPSGQPPKDDSPRQRYDFPHIQVTMMHVLSFGTMLVTVSVGLLALGTLVMLALVIVQRRATLNQLNTSLIQISSQLKELQLRENNR